jgi:hypothetical protein
MAIQDKAIMIVVGGMLVLASLSGCSSFVGKPGSGGTWPWSKAEVKPKLPTRILTIWTDAVHHQAGKKGERGFGGRVVFYEDGSETPIQVDGTLSIYVFADEAGKESPEPERKFVFGAEQLKRHYGKCSLGDSYSVWLPWDVVGGESRQLTLIARFDSNTGGTVMSDPAKKMLPGLSKRSESVAEEDESSNGSSGQPSAMASSQLRPLAPTSGTPMKPTANIRSTSSGSANKPAASGRSIAEFLQDQGEVSSSTSSGLRKPGKTDTGVAQVGYDEYELSESGESVDQEQAVPSVDSRVETIQLGRLGSNNRSVIAVPQHLMNQSLDESMAENSQVFEGHESEEQAVRRTSVSYGRPGENRLSGSPSREDAESKASSETQAEPWPRRTRTMGSGRRSIAESRRDAMADRRPEKLDNP